MVHKRDFARKLVCNIEGGAGAKTQINHLHEGILYGLAGDLEKHSDVLGRNAIWAKTSRIASLPRYICVQMMRFFWKATPESQDHAGVKCKVRGGEGAGRKGRGDDGKAASAGACDAPVAAAPY